MCISIILLIPMVSNSESEVTPSDGVITPLPVWGPGYEVSFEFYLNSVSGDYQFLFGVAGNAGDEDVAFGQPCIFIYGDKLPIWFALNGHGEGRDDAGDYWAGDTLDLWKHPYGGSVTIDVNKWHQVSVSSIKEDGKVKRLKLNIYTLFVHIHI